ncbi:hypothetical protein AMECASPLE_001116 [Ameca splendens]|uniref:Secreted protein n=1 Tax=Ameca splendens TaxID=208324 RepID=A0ABV0XB87_9TELE
MGLSFLWTLVSFLSPKYLVCNLEISRGNFLCEITSSESFVQKKNTPKGMNQHCFYTEQRTCLVVLYQQPITKTLFQQKEGDDLAYMISLSMLHRSDSVKCYEP